jgi:murein DD-endopeptidase MepM/ murein hydrolase activator NlpD
VRLAAAAAVLALVGSLLIAQPAAADTAPAAPSPDPSPSPSASPSPSPSDSPSPSPSDSPSPSPSPSDSPSPSSASPTPDPNQPLYDRLKTRLSADLATALADQQRLSAALDAGRLREQALYDQVDAASARVADLEDQISQLDDQITTTQDRVDAERSQVATLARSMYRRPSNWLVVLARAKSVQDALVESADLIVAGQRAHALQARLEADLAKLNSDRGARQDDLDRENATVDALNAAVSELDSQLGLQDDVSNQLLDLSSQMQDAIAQLRDQSPADAPALVALLEEQQKNLAVAEAQQAWSLAAAGSGRLQARGLLPASAAPAGLKLTWPMPGAPISQPFGPSSLVLEPPLGSYPHFHTGVDFADPAGTAVEAAGDGIVVAAATGRIGYGNYLVIAHGQGVETLYGHLDALSVAVGDSVIQGQVIGFEGSTGFSTGPHLHFEVRVDGQFVDPLVYLLPEVAAVRER